MRAQKILARVCAANGKSLPKGMLAATAMTTSSDGESERWHQRALKPLRGLGKLLDREVRAAT